MGRLTGHMQRGRNQGDPRLPPRSDPYRFRELFGVDITSIAEAVNHELSHIDNAHPFSEVEEKFGFMAPELLDLESITSQVNPQVSQVLRSRLKAVFDKRGEVNFSQCECKSSIELAGHDNTFQEEYKTLWPLLNEFRRGDGRTTAKFICLCPKLTEKVDIYGVLGEGTFGIAFLAREIDLDLDSEECQQFAIKAQAHKTEVDQMLEHTNHAEMVVFQEPTGQEHYIPEEALILIYLNDSNRFPTVDSIYTHGLLWSIVMHPCIDPNTEGKETINNFEFRHIREHETGRVYRYVFPSFPAFSGVYLKGKNKKPVVNEMQGCKIAGQFLEGMIQLADMGIYHHDISVNNYLMDQNLNVQLIDLGQVDFSLNDKGFQSDRGGSIPFQEYQMRPELAIEYLKYEQEAYQSAEMQTVHFPHDLRGVCLWKYSTIVYGFLHGYWPWEETDPKSAEWHSLYYGRYDEDLYRPIAERRERMINEDISVNETLSQDCRDVLQSALSRDIEERPSLQEMNSFPWFSQWSAEECESGRPLKRPRIGKFKEDNRGQGRKR